jgi:hypothetical protein
MIAEIKLAVWEDGPLASSIIFRKLSVTFRAGSMLRFFFPPAAIDGYYYEFCFFVALQVDAAMTTELTILW